jgi:hypothetical protein
MLHSKSKRLKKMIMKKNIYKTIACIAFLGLSLSSCSDFLDQPAKDNYNVSNFYQNDEQCRQGVDPIYNSPWYGFQRGFFKVGEVLSGNFYWGSSPYLTFTLTGSDDNLVDMSASLWSVNAYCNTVYDNISNSSGPSETVKNYCKGECLTWKAMAYFYLVRTFGAVPIIHNNTDEIGAGTYNDKYKARIEDIYDYIIMTLKKAIELLPAKDATKNGRLDKYCAEGLLAKVYLTKSGFSADNTKYVSGSYSYIETTAHQRNTEDLANAAKYAKDVIDNSGRTLMPTYSDIFRLKNNVSDEALISWAWAASSAHWTCQNSLQSDLAITGFDEFGDCWGGYIGPSVDLQDAFGENALSPTRNNTDDRRKATMMMAGDKYDYFYTDNGGFDYLKFIYGGYEKHTGPGEFQSPTGANEVKHLYGDAADHLASLGVSAARMISGLYTHILRLADVYLIYAEAVLGDNTSTSDASAIDAFFKVRSRSVKSYSKPTSLTFDDIWKERRLELSCEGDRWYDYVRLFYFNPTKAINELTNQRRDVYYSLDIPYKSFYEAGEKGAFTFDANTTRYNTSATKPNVTTKSFTIPLPSSDITYNSHLTEDPQHVDVTQYTYK